MSGTRRKTTELRRIFNDPETTLMPMGVLPLHAQMAERAGFPAFEIGGGGFCRWIEGVPDAGLITMTEMVSNAAKVARSVDIPVFCDADTGFGTALNAFRTTQEFIRAGIAGIHIEDQLEPKKAGGQPGMKLVSDEEAVGRLRAAVDAKNELDPDFVIVARTDARAAEGGSVEEAIRRSNLYLKEAGADVAFYEGLRTWDEVRLALRETDGPAYVLASRHAGPAPSRAELTAMGQSIQVFSFMVPAVQEPWLQLLEVMRSGEVAVIEEYQDRMRAEYEGTEYYTWHGDMFGTPTYAQIREREAKYYPAYMRRDYENTIHD